MIFDIMAVLAEFKWDLTSEKTKLAALHRKEKNQLRTDRPARVSLYPAIPWHPPRTDHIFDRAQLPSNLYPATCQVDGASYTTPPNGRHRGDRCQVITISVHAVMPSSLACRQCHLLIPQTFKRYLLSLNVRRLTL